MCVYIYIYYSSTVHEVLISLIYLQELQVLARNNDLSTELKIFLMKHKMYAYIIVRINKKYIFSFQYFTQVFK